MKYVLQDMRRTVFKDSPVFVESFSRGTVTLHSAEAERYSREVAIELQNETNGDYRALPENAPIVEDNT